MNTIRLTNSMDRENAFAGTIEASAVRSETIEALVDTGATTLAIPEDVAKRLGLRFAGTRNVKMANGEKHAIAWVTGVSLEILGREMTCDALVLPPGVPALIGQIPLEALDLIVDPPEGPAKPGRHNCVASAERTPPTDPKNREVRVNPESPDVPLLDLYRLSA